jgi:serine/threonine protein phosphatase PrpC
MAQAITLHVASRNIIKMPKEYASTAMFSRTLSGTDGCLLVITEAIRAIFTRPDLTSSIPAQVIPTELKALQNGSAKGFSTEFVCERINSAFERANLTLYNEKLSRPDQMRDFSGSSATCVFILGKTAYVGHVGIIRVYLLRDNTLRQLTQDHSAYAMLKSKDEIDDLNKFSWSQHLIRALGHKETVTTDIIVQSLEIGDRLLLCSSGIWLMTPEAELLEFLNSVKDLEVVANQIVDVVYQKIYMDFSFALIEIVSE